MQLFHVLLITYVSTLISSEKVVELSSAVILNQRRNELLLGGASNNLLVLDIDTSRILREVPLPISLISHLPFLSSYPLLSQSQLLSVVIDTSTVLACLVSSLVATRERFE
jgi:hypothetical protein